MDLGQALIQKKLVPDGKEVNEGINPFAFSDEVNNRPASLEIFFVSRKFENTLNIPIRFRVRMHILIPPVNYNGVYER
jgi:hypothetical protein